MLNRIRTLICQKKYEEAWELVRSLPEEEKQSGDAITLSARLQGQMGNFSQALQMFEDLETAWPDRPMIFKLHGTFLQESGHTEDALEKARKMIVLFPEFIDGYNLAAECLEILGRPLEAIELTDSALKKCPGNSGLLEARRRLEPLCERKEQIDTQIEAAREELELSHCQITHDEDFMERYLQLFDGREGVHARQCRFKGRKFGYMPVHCGLDKDLLKSHLAGDQTLGLYLVKQDNSARLMAIDLDIAKSYLNSYLHSANEQKRIRKKLFEVTTGLLGIAENAGFELLIESSGYKGVHLWAFSDFAVPARHWRLLGKWLVEQLPCMPAEIQAEVFPKQEIVAEKGLGNLVKLPLGIHQASGRRSLFLERNTFRPWPMQREALENLQPITRSEFEEILGRITLTGVKDNVHTEASFIESPASLSPARRASADLRPDPELSLRVKMRLPERFTVEIEQVLAGCRPLCEILNRAVQSGHIEPEWRHVFIYIFATMGEEGKVFIHQVMSQLSNYDPDRVNAEMRAVPPTTMSCGKIRKYVPAFAAQFGCGCQFRLPPGCYPSPVAHAGIFPGSGRTVFQPVAAPAALSVRELIAGGSASIDKLMLEFRELGEEIARLRQRHLLLRRQINRLFDNAGCNEIVTRLGTYNRLPDSEEEAEENLTDNSQEADGEK
ncbi:MAG TPA: CRISPR-associated primase-polymerase type A1 [Candidatus Ozemobacteraceae bacterium]|nr:CRISPR-associated primase-polymerase type A1 [Candidatus Ozemobacteraceae bacterium]